MLKIDKNIFLWKQSVFVTWNTNQFKGGRDFAVITVIKLTINMQIFTQLLSCEKIIYIIKTLSNNTD